MQVTTAWPFLLALLFVAALPLGWAFIVRGRLGRTRAELSAVETRLARERLEHVWLVSRSVSELERPLRLLGASLDLALHRRRDTAELSAQLEDAKREVDRLSTLAARIQLLVEPRHKREASDLGLLVKAAVDATKAQAAARQVEVALEGPTQLAGSFDARGLQQAVEELLTNAIRVTKYGTRVRVKLEDGFRGKLRVRVVDEGPGFGNELPQTVFEPFLFHRTAPAAGFGLALARKIAREHGGDVTLEQPKSGGEVVLELQER